MSGTASANSLVNLSMARIISPDDVEAIMANQPAQEQEQPPEQETSPQSDVTQEQSVEQGEG
jgi:hypothetical protein